MTSESPGKRARENATELVSMFITGLWLALLFIGPGNLWLAVMLFGYIVVVPTVELLYGNEADEELDDTAVNSSHSENTEDPLEELRRRYAQGELTDEQFERKVERLLETESLEDIEGSDRFREKELE